MEPRRQITPSDLIDGEIVYPAVMIQAAKKAARSKMWQGTWDERFEKIQAMTREVFTAFGVEEGWQVVHVGEQTGMSRGKINRRLPRITLSGKLSVVTTLFLIAKVQGCTTAQAIRWAVTLFAKCFPRSFARCAVGANGLVNEGRGDA